MGQSDSKAVQMHCFKINDAFELREWTISVCFLSFMLLPVQLWHSPLCVHSKPLERHAAASQTDSSWSNTVCSSHGRNDKHRFEPFPVIPKGYCSTSQHLNKRFITWPLLFVKLLPPQAAASATSLTVSFFFFFCHFFAKRDKVQFGVLRSN